MEQLSLIDVTSEDDLLISASFDRHRDLRSSENFDGLNCPVLESSNVREGENLLKMSKQWEYIPEMSESPEQKRAKSGKVNLRKSLAWDSAFFTSEGVLNTDELAIVNSTFRKTEACSLPGIQEELQKSTESTSTLNSESYALENLEGDLFNLRASIQRSVGNHDNSSSEGSDASRLGSRKKVERSFQTEVKPPIALKGDGATKRGLECTSKEALLGVKEATKGGANPKLMLKPPRIVPKPTLPTVPTNKDSSGIIQMKNNTKRASPGNGPNRQGIVAFSKIDGDSCNMTSRSISVSKPTHLGRMVFSSNNSPASGSSNLPFKSSLENTNRKRSALRNSGQPLLGSTTKIPVRTPKSKLGPLNKTSTQPTNSTFRFFSKLSPSSSIDSFVSEASSSTSTSIKPSNSVESFSSTTSSALSCMVPTETDAPQRKNNTSVDVVQSRGIVKASLSTHVLSEPSNAKSFNINAGTKSFKPSGLRMPSPKLGYFDAGKTLAGNSNKISQNSLRNSFLKGSTGTNESISTNKVKSTKIPSLRHAAKHLPVNSNSSQAEPSQATCALNNEDRLMANQIRSVSEKYQKENLFPSECENISVVDTLDEKMSSLSLSETAGLAGGD